VAATVSASRELILRRIRSSLGEHAGAAVTIPREYQRRGTLEREARVAMLCERIGDYRARVRRCAVAELGEVIAEEFEAQGARRICVPAGIPAEWRSGEFEWLPEEELDLAALDRVDGVLTGCTLAIAQTGTIALSAGAGEGRRAISLVPDLHLCVIEEEQVVETVPEAIAALGEPAGRGRPITLISGPSATSDIELDRVEGVHGPRRLIVIVVSKEPT
jgi:L-lactate dehydrogenase complex protein LldG